MNLSQWLEKLENRHQQEIQLGLARILKIAQKLRLNTPKAKVITVAGTNGKGSTVSALEMIYHTAGFKVGAYTSPHLLRFNERIRVNLDPITDADLCSIFSHIESARESTVLTYFEMTTLAALYYFQQKNLDIIILEVGIGGRLDATNIINPDLAIITTIDFDHQDYLGDNLDKIGSEKAGILRESIPFIYADSNPPQSIIDAATSLNTRTFIYGKEYSIVDKSSSWDLNFLDQSINLLPKPKIQLKSAAAAIIASQLLGLNDHQVFSKAMEAIFIPGRLELQPGIVSVLYDVSHNPQSARLLAQKLNAIKKGRVHAVFSALKDKDIDGLIFPLKTQVDYWYPAQLESKRSLNVQDLLLKLKNAEISVDICYNSPLQAFAAATCAARPDDLIVVYGSFLTVAAVMAAKEPTEPRALASGN